ncbi:ABC transporter permease [Paenibacillus motobuensis]|uniref:Transport permease protein n=1 Tax=Paenibacillus motobuensis TaxID=295324 RepID=A0ABP3HST0_9BACL
MKTQISNFFKYRDLLIELIVKDIKIKYRNSYLGVLWSLLNPLLMVIVLSIVFSTLFKHDIANYPLYLLTGRLVYSYFAEATNFAMDSIIVNSQLIKKVYVPKYFFPISRVISSFVTSLISLIPVVGVMIFTGVSFSLYNLLFFIPMLILMFISMGIGLILSTVTVFFRDLKHFYSILLTIVMYMTPIFYPANIIPDKYRVLIEFNPLFPVLSMFRDVLIYQQRFNYFDLIVSFAYAVFFVVAGMIMFYKKQDRFIFYL